jgi:hypothetical protein
MTLGQRFRTDPVGHQKNCGTFQGAHLRVLPAPEARTSPSSFSSSRLFFVTEHSAMPPLAMRSPGLYRGCPNSTMPEIKDGLLGSLLTDIAPRESQKHRGALSRFSHSQAVTD